MTKKALRGSYRIVAVNKIAPDIVEMRISAPEIARIASPGQFVNVYLPGGEMLLPRPICIADAADDSVTLVFAVVGKGTEALSRFAGGQYIELMGPLGTGFFDYPGSPTADSLPDDSLPDDSLPVDSLPDDSLPDVSAARPGPAEVLLIGGGTGVAPLYFAARKLESIHVDRLKRTACLGFSVEPWYTDDLKRVCDEVLIGSETEGMAAFHGNVIELLDTMYNSDNKHKSDITKKPVLALACGPRPMLAAAAKWCETRDIPLRVSLEERMGCGYGACAGCSVNTPAANGIIKKKVCVHGPVFWANEVLW